MGESSQHLDLISRIVTWIHSTHESRDGLSILIDSGPIAVDKRPRPISGFVPDVFAQTVPPSFVIIGEAKSYRDFFTEHTKQQFAAYMDYLILQPDPILVIGTPFALAGATRNLIRRIQRQGNAARVRTIFIHS